MKENKDRIVLDVAYQPQVRTNTDTRRIMLDVIIALLPAVVVGVINFGVAILLPIATSVASAVFFEWAYRKFMKKPDTIGDLTAVLTGLLMAMTMPPQAPWWMPIIGTFFAIVVVKQLYGGIGKNFMNPALAARAFLMLAWPNAMTASPQPFPTSSMFSVSVDSADIVASATPMQLLKTGTIPDNGIFNMLQNLSETVVLPIAAAILACVMCMELIQMITEKNNMHDFDSSMFFRWIFKSAFAILIVSNTWNIVMGIFDATQSVVNQSAGVIIGETSVDFNSLIPDLESQLEAMSVGGLLGLWFQTLVVGLTMNILAICIFLVTYGRMIEIYVVTSLGPIPLATMGNSEWRGMGQNYLKSLLALGFQAFLIMVVVGIYAVLIQNIASASDISGAIWGCMGYTVLLCFCLFKTGSISKSVFSAH